MQHRRDFQGSQWALSLGHQYPVDAGGIPCRGCTPSSPGTHHLRRSFCCVLALLLPLTNQIILPSSCHSLLCLCPCFHRECVNSMSVQSCTCVVHAKYEPFCIRSCHLWGRKKAKQINSKLWHLAVSVQNLWMLGAYNS